MVVLNSKGEIIDVNEADQFQPGKSQFECGFFAVAEAKSMAQPGQPPTLSVSQIIADAEGWYAQYDGTDAITNTNGMTLPQLYNLLQEVGLHYQSTTPDSSIVKQWIQAGYPVIIALTESSVHDLALGDANPYPWTPAGTHIILVTGVTSNGNVLVRDSANCTNLYDPNSLRPGPRTYDAAKLVLVSATVVVPPWMPRPTSSTPPAQKGENMNISLVNGTVAKYFRLVNGDQWLCVQTGKIIHGAILACYVGYGNAALCGLTYLGLPKSDEVPIENINPVYQHLAGKGIMVQFYECGSLIYDPAHLVDSRPGLTASVYPAHIYDDNAPGLDPAIGNLEAQIAALQKQQGNPQEHSILLQVKQLVAPIS